MHEVVLLLEDDARLAAFLDRGLTEAGYHVATARNGQLPDVVVAAGLHQLASARMHPSVPVLLLTSCEGVDERIRGLDAGADDVLAKPFHLEELVARVRALSRRRQLNATAARQGVLRYADLELDQDRRDVTRGGRRVEVRNRGFELLQYLMRNPERVVSRQELLQMVWGWAPDSDSNVIEVTVSHLRQALEALGEPRLIHTVRPVGYILRT
jgi:DNA-binding response OmpR family regulator